MILFSRFLLISSFDILRCIKHSRQRLTKFRNTSKLANILYAARRFLNSLLGACKCGTTRFLVFDVLVHTLTPALNWVTAVVVRRKAFVEGFISRILRDNNNNEAQFSFKTNCLSEQFLISYLRAFAPKTSHARTNFFTTLTAGGKW